MTGTGAHESHARLAGLFGRIVALPEAARGQALAQLDAATRVRLERLLAADAESDDPLALAIERQAREATAPVAHGARLGAYRVLRELGAGGMGAVLLAERADGQFTQKVAIKLIRGFPTEDGKRRLRQERQILAQLDHPNIAHLVDGGETDDGQPYVVMEYVDGLPLLEHVARRLPGLAARLALFDAIAAAVQHAHEHLVIHRDLKPGNVLVREDGQPKLLDFGVATLVNLSAGSDPRQTSTRVWTAGYASPEQRAGRTVTTASDVYALGILLREMLTGERRPGESSVMPAGFVMLAPAADLRGILAKAAAEVPRERYPTVEALRADLQRWREGRPVTAAADTALYRLRKFVSRHRLGVAVTALVLMVAATFVWRLDHERERALAAETRASAALAAAERDAATARAALDFLTDALGAAMPEQAMSAQVSVRDLLDHARAELEGRGNLEPRLRQPVQRLLGHLYAALGEPKIAAELFERGLAGVEPTLKNEALALADDYAGWSGALGTLERGLDSLAAARRAAALRQQFAPEDPVQELEALSQLGYAHNSTHDDAQAEREWLRALELAAALPQPPVATVIATYHALGDLLVKRNQSERALALAREGLAFADAHLPAESPLRIPLLRTLGAALVGQGLPDQSERALREAIAMQERIVGTRGARLGLLYSDLGIALSEQGRYREALAAFERSQVLGVEAADTHEDIAISLSNLASVHESAGDYPTALSLFEQSLQRWRQSGADPDTLGFRKLEVNQARCLALAGEHARAGERLASLRQRARQLDGEDSFAYALATWQSVVLMRRMRDPERGEPLLDEAAARFSALLPETHPILAHVGRARADFAAMRGQYERAEREQRAALAALEAAGVLEVDVAIARAELAGILAARGGWQTARALLDEALPVLRDALLPQEVHRAAAEDLANSLFRSP